MEVRERERRGEKDKEREMMDDLMERRWERNKCGKMKKRVLRK
jgi:hypothetical protein